MRWMSMVFGMLLLLLGLTLPTRITQAQTGTPPFHAMGVIHRMDVSERVMVLNDQMLLFPSTTPVFMYNPALQDPDALRAEKQRRTISALRPGMRIGYNVEREGGRGAGRISEVWLLPPGTKAAGEKER